MDLPGHRAFERIWEVIKFIIFILLIINTIVYLWISEWSWSRIHSWCADMFLRWLYTKFLGSSSGAITAGVYHRVTGRAGEVELNVQEPEPVVGTNIEDNASRDTL